MGQFVAESADLSDEHPAEHAWACQELGQPECSDAKDMSTTSRKRLFWHNLGSGGGAAHGPVDANTLLGPASSLKGGARTAPCLVASWRCEHRDCRGSHCNDPQNHTTWQRMHSPDPVIITEGGRDRQIKPAEAEALMGYPRGYTQTGGTANGTEIVPDWERLRQLGAASDVRQLTQLVRRATTRTEA